MQLKNNNQKYPPCPGCGAIGKKGLTITRLEGRLRCMNCNSMFEFEWDKNFNIKVGRSIGE